MIVRDRPASSRTDAATMPPLAFNCSQPVASISKPITGTFASIRRSDRAVPIRPRPMIPMGAITCMIGSPFPVSQLLGFDAGGLGICRPSNNLAADEGAEFLRAHRGNDHADACEPLPGRRHHEEFFPLGMELADDRFRRTRRR